MSTTVPYTAPALGCKAFNCPDCGAFAHQRWDQISNPWGPVLGLTEACCEHCHRISIWYRDKMIYPSGGSAPSPNPDMPEDIRQDYEEARSIATLSPRGAAALLRLAIQKLCVHLGENGDNINADIGSLVEKGLPMGVQKALDSVRVIGNDAVHPGMIDLRDDPAMVAALFGLVNFVADKMISEPKEIDEIYDTLPPEKIAQIERRDS